jgi:hypothetical protein
MPRRVYVYSVSWCCMKSLIEYNYLLAPKLPLAACMTTNNLSLFNRPRILLPFLLIYLLVVVYLVASALVDALLFSMLRKKSPKLIADCLQRDGSTYTPAIKASYCQRAILQSCASSVINRLLARTDGITTIKPT